MRFIAALLAAFILVFFVASSSAAPSSSSSFSSKSLTEDNEAEAYWPPNHPFAQHPAVAAKNRVMAATATGTPSWSYDRLSSVGPQFWNSLPAFPACAGLSQSPIDVQTSSVSYDPTLRPLNFNYQSWNNRTIVNNGHAIQVNENPGVTTSTLSGGALTAGSVYFLAQFHIHAAGEHQINGGSYPLELHLVHVNTDPTQTNPPTARELTVVGLLFKEGNYNPAMQAFANASVPLKTTDAFGYVDINLNALLPRDQSYYTYQGSLTNPGCRETVTWHVMKQVQEVSPAQLDMIRNSLVEKNNYRPVQPLNGRLVRTNFAGSSSSSAVDASSSGSSSVNAAGNVININFAGLLSGFKAA